MHSSASAQVLVIGAGPAGLAAAAALTSLGVPFDLVDSQNHVGGVWNVGNDDAPSWPSMPLATSKQHTQFDDLRMPVSFPAYPTTDQYATYLRAYAAHHGITDSFEPRTTVRRARPFGEGQWEVELSNGEVRAYSAIIAAHGISNRPFLPPLFFEAKDAGVRAIHSKNFAGAEYTSEKRVLVIGSGQEAADVASELADGKHAVTLHMSEGHWVVPRTVGPFAANSLALLEPGILGRSLNQKIAEKVVTKLVGRPEDSGLPAPTVPLLDDEPIVSDDLISKINAGKIQLIDSTHGLALDSFDLIVFATGYEPGVDYLDHELSEDLFLGAFPRERNDLFILGQVRVVGGVMPVLTQHADIAAYAVRALLDQLESAQPSAALEAFAALKQRSDRDVKRSSRASIRSARGLRAKAGSVASKLGSAVRQQRGSSAALADASHTVDEWISDDQALQLPLSDRETLLGRLYTARKIFEK